MMAERKKKQSSFASDGIHRWCLKPVIEIYAAKLKIFQPLKGAIVTGQSMLFTLPVSGYKVVVYVQNCANASNQTSAIKTCCLLKGLLHNNASYTTKGTQLPEITVII